MQCIIFPIFELSGCKPRHALARLRMLPFPPYGKVLESKFVKALTKNHFIGDGS